MRLDGCISNAATCRSLELGMIRCLDEISEQIRRSLGLSLTAAQIVNCLRGKTSNTGNRPERSSIRRREPLRPPPPVRHHHIQLAFHHPLQYVPEHLFHCAHNHCGTAELLTVHVALNISFVSVKTPGILHKDTGCEKIQ